MPILYRVGHDLTKGVKEVEVVSINNDNTFTYVLYDNRNRTRKLESQHGNDSSYFTDKIYAEKYLIDKIYASIEFHQKVINKYKELLESFNN
jgi:hypothetical protein